MIQTALKRKERENPYTGLPLPDTVREQTKNESVLTELFKEYELCLEKKIQDYKSNMKIIDRCTFILNPAEINDFLQKTIMYGQHENYRENTGIFITGLIQTSYNNSYNDFHLNTKNIKDIEKIAYGIKADKDPLNIRVTGDVERGFGAFAENCRLYLEGAADLSCGHGAKHSIFNIKGDVSDYCGEEATITVFNIYGNVGSHCGTWANESVFNIYKDTGSICGHEARKSIFNVKGDARDSCGSRSKESIFLIYGSAGEGFGIYAEKSKFCILGKTKRNCGNNSKECTFITPDKMMYNGFKALIPEDNIMILTDRYGNIIERKEK